MSRALSLEQAMQESLKLVIGVVKLILALWVVAGHVMVATKFATVGSCYGQDGACDETDAVWHYISTLKRSPFFIFVFGFGLSVDVFFGLSGFLECSKSTNTITKSPKQFLNVYT